MSVYNIIAQMSTPSPIFLFVAAAMLAPTVGSAVTIQIVADNDFALFAGDSTSLTRLVYQNNVSWSSQISAASSLNVTLEGSETHFYLFALGGGGEENISGRINGVDLANISNQVQKSGNVASYLTGYSSSLGDVADGTYSVQFADASASVAAASWFAPTLGYGAVVGMSGFNLGYTFSSNNAIIYKFVAEAVLNPPAVPEPSTYGLALGGLALALAISRRRRA